MTTNDTTNNLLRSLEREPEKWNVTRGVPLFRAHRREMPATEFDPNPRSIVVTDHDLEHIADAVNETIRTAGRLPTFTLGHRKFGPVAEASQPPLLGFHLNFRTQRVRRPEGDFLALVADEYAAVDRVKEHDLYRQFPFRSGEYHPDAGYKGTAALQQPPWLELGTVFQYRADGPQDRKAALLAEYRADVHRLRVAESERLLAPLRGLYSMDYEREMSHLVAYRSDAERLAHVRYIERNHEPLSARDPHVPAPHHGAAMAYLLANPGISYQDAEQRVLVAR